MPDKTVEKTNKGHKLTENESNPSELQFQKINQFSDQIGTQPCFQKEAWQKQKQDILEQQEELDSQATAELNTNSINKKCKISRWHILGFLFGVLLWIIIFKLLILDQQQYVQSSITQTKLQFKDTKQTIQKIQDRQQTQSKEYFGLFYPSKDKVPDSRKVSAVFTTCCDRYDLLQITLDSFFKFSTFPYETIIVVVDGTASQQLNHVLDSFKSRNLTLIETVAKIGQVNAIDKAYSYIKTPYIFHSEDDWEYLHEGFVQESLVWLQKQPNLVQVWIQKHNLPIQPQTRKSLSKYTLSFNPGLRRLSDYTQVQSYSKLTHNSSYGLGAGMAEQFISAYYLGKQRYVVQSQTQYTKHLGSQRSNKKYWKNIP